MKTYVQEPKMVLSLEKDDEANPTGMQLRVWSIDRGITLLVRMLRHNSDVHENLWDNKRTNNEVCDYVLDFLKNQGLVTNKEAWDFSVNISNTLSNQDEYEEKKDCIYFAWTVQEWRLDF